MALASTGSGFRDDGADHQTKETASASPAQERKKLLETLMTQEAKGQRSALSQELIQEVGEKGPSEKDKIDLLASVLDKQQLENIHRQVEVLKTNPEEIDDAKAEALRFMRDTVPYMLSVLAIRFDVKEATQLKAFTDLLPKVMDPEEKELLEGVSFLTSRPDLETSRYFMNSQVPEIMADAKVLTQAARDAIDAVKDKSVTTWMGEKMKEYPVATGAFLLLGSFGLYEAGRWLYHKAKGDETETKTEKGPGLFGRLTEGWSFLTKAAISTLVFGGGTLIAGNVLGNEQVEKYLREHHMGALYDWRLTAALIRFCQGDFEEGLATWNFGPRDADARLRHEIYSEYFAVTDKSVWVMAGVNFKTMMEADPKREFPLATGFFASVPFLKDWFKMPDQVTSENKVIDMIKTHETQIRTAIPDADKLTVDEVLKKAFELNLFEASDSAGAAGYSDDLKGFIGEKEKDSKAFREEVTALGAKTELEAKDIQRLKDVEGQVAKELDQLRLTVPTYWTEMMENISLTFPGLVIDEDKVQDMDLASAHKFYKSFADAASKSDLDAIGLDEAELKKIIDFTGKLDTSKPLSASDQALLSKYTEDLARMHDNVQRSIVDAKVAKRKEIADDEARKGYAEFMSDTKDFCKIYLHGYGGMFYGLQWGIEKAVGENQTPGDRVIGVTATAASTSMILGAGYGVYIVSTGEKLEKLGGVARILCPPLTYFDVRRLYYSFLKDPATLLEAVIKGKVNPEWAEKMCTAALKNKDMIPETTPIAGQWLEHRMDYYKTLKSVFKNRVRLEWLENTLTGKVPFDRTAKLETWQEELINLVEKRSGMTFEKFLEKMVAERGEGRILLEAFDKTPFELKAKMVRFFEEAAKRFGALPIPKPVVEQLFEKGGAGLRILQYFTKNAGRFGMTAGMAYLATYYVCKDTYDSKDKSERISLFALSILVSEGVFRGIRAAELAPKHPIIMGIVALLAAFGLSTKAEEIVAPYLKNPSLLATSVRGIAAPVLYTAGAGQLVDTVGHYYNATSSTEKDYFMREIYLPLLGSKKMAFRDGDVGYFNEMSPEDAVEVWNYQVREKIKTLSDEDEALRVAGKSQKHQQEIAELNLKIIDKDWISRQIGSMEGKKAEVSSMGQSLYAEIVAQFGPTMSPVEKRLVESLLVTDVPESWFDESFYDIEKDSRFALVRKFAHAIDKDAELDTFVERKRGIYSDIEFYRTIKVDDQIMHATQSEKLVAMLGIDPSYAEEADQLYKDIMGSDAAELNDAPVAEDPPAQQAA